MEIRLRILRFDPAVESSPRYQTYSVGAEPEERLLDCLNRVRWEQDGTLAYRMSCAHGICGSDAMKINGRCGLACQKLVKEFREGEVTLEPLPTFTVLKDLIVDLEPFFRRIDYVRPYLVAADAPPERERIQNQADKKRVDEVIRCILCASCSAQCPVENENGAFLGPAPLVWAFRYIFDSRDGQTPERLKLLDHPDGIWPCVNHYECTRVCPKGIHVTRCINEMKKEIQARISPNPGQPSNAERRP